jgi:uncharacterized protein (DUF983 family)
VTVGVDSPSVDPARKGQPPLARAALFGLCPDCGGKTLFGSFLQFAPKCPTCGLDFSRFNVGDGPAALLTLVIGALMIALAMTVEFAFYPPFWVHVLLWVPLTAIAVGSGLRAAKAALLITEHRRQAHEGRQVTLDSDDG